MSRTARAVFVDGEMIGYLPVTNAENVEYGNTNVKAALDGLSSDKVNKSGDTMTGNLIIEKAGETYVTAKNTNTSVVAYLDSDANAEHGVWSNGYNNGSFQSSGRWLLKRGISGDVYANDTKVPYNGGTLALTKDVIPYKTNGGLGSVAGNGTDAYAFIAEIKPSGQYQNRPIYLEISGRNTIFVTLTLRFSNTTSTDPGLDIFTANTSDASNFRIFKTATSTWQLYYYIGTWDDITLHRISGAQSDICIPKMTWVSASNLPDTWENGRVPTHSDFNSLNCTRHAFSETLTNDTALTLLTYTATKDEYKNIFAIVRFKADGASVTANHGIYNVKMKINGNTVIEEQHGFVEKTYYTASLSGVLPLKTGDVVTVTAVENNGVSIPIDGSLWY